MHLLEEQVVPGWISHPLEGQLQEILPPPTYCPQKLTQAGKVSYVSSLDAAACDFIDGESYHITGNMSSETLLPL